MSDSVRDLLTRGVAAAKANDKEEAQFYLEWVLRSGPTHAQRIRAWEWLAQVTDDPQKKRDYLEEIITREPGNVKARRGLAMLQGQLKAEDIIDPTHRSATAKSAPDQASDIQAAQYGPDQPETEASQSKRFICQSCGGLMAFTPDGSSLSCDYCDRQINLHQAIQEGAMVEEQDFAVALATAKGHTHPETMQAFSCQGCGAPFILGPAVLSLTCPYCASAHVIEERETRRLVPPEGVLPFALSQAQIRKPFRQWLQQKHLLNRCQVSRPSGLYIPVWTFDIAGTVIARARGFEPQEHPIFYDDIPVPASHRLPAKLAAEIHNFQLDQVVPYDSGYLADWPADTYQISAAEASLVARKQAWQDVRASLGPQIKEKLVGPFGTANVEVTLSSANMYVAAFKLILLPLWVIRYQYQNQSYETVVNGQNGHVRGQTPSGGFKRWLGKIWAGN